MAGAIRVGSGGRRPSVRTRPKAAALTASRRTLLVRRSFSLGGGAGGCRDLWQWSGCASGPTGPIEGLGLVPLVFAGTSDRSQEAPAMTNPDRPRHIEVGDGGQPVAAAEVTTAPEPTELCGRRCMRRPGTLPLAAVRAWLMRSWICPRCRPARVWRPLSRSATANRSSVCGSGPRMPSRVRLALPRCWTRIYLQAPPEPGQDPDGGTQAAASDALDRWSARPRLARSTDAPEVRLAGRSRPGDPWHPGWR